jgi:hypothetical protein
MALDSNNVRSAPSGAVSLGAVGADAPTGAVGALTGFTDLGFISDAGVTESRARNTNEINAWQGGTLVRTMVTSGSLTYHFVLIETKKETVQLFYGSPVTAGEDDGSVIILPTSTGGRQAFVLDVVDGIYLTRTYIPQGEVTEVGDLVYVNSDPVGYDVTISAYPDVDLGASAKVWSTALKAVA